MPSGREIIPYSCICGITIADRSKSLKQHLITQKHLNKVGECPPHHWSIASANGPTSAGVCSKCREIKHFENSLQTGGGWYTQMATEKSQKEWTEQEEVRKLVT